MAVLTSELATRVGVDPVTVEVVRNALPAISDEMSYDLQRTSYSSYIYEVRDYSTAILEPDGRLLSQYASGCSHFAADLGIVIRDGVARYGLDGFKPGDVIITNHQAIAGQHLNNVGVYTPCFVDGKLVAFPAVRAHWIDIGGFGFASGQVFDPWSEGLQFDQLKIYEAGVRDDKLYKLIHDNIRMPEVGLGDMRSQIAACRLAERRLSELWKRYGHETMRKAIDVIYDEAEQRCRAAVEKIPDGEYEAESWYSNPRTGGDPYYIHTRVVVSGGDMTIDFSKGEKAHTIGMNCRSHAAAFVAYKALTTPNEPLCEGSFRALNAIIPEGNMMMAPYPYPMANWSPIFTTVIATVLKALSGVIPMGTGFGRGGGENNLMGIDPRSGKEYHLQAKEACGGWGARADSDGQDNMVQSTQGDVRNTPIEAEELKAPILILERSIWQDSGGPGRFRGGLGAVNRARTLAQARWPVGNAGGGGSAAWPLYGGKPGKDGERMFKQPGEAEFRKYSGGYMVFPAGTECWGTAGGGGGWGDPLARDLDAVREDVAEGWVSLTSAREDYGVVFEDDGGVDEAETEKLRAEMKRKAT